MIFHLAVRSEWRRDGTYRPPSLTDDGFIHCSTTSQLIDVANALYAGRTDLIVLTIDPDLLDAPVVHEDCYETGMRYPHIYGTIRPEAVVDEQPLQPGSDGKFAWDSL